MLDELEKLEREATEGPWRLDDPSWKELNDITVWAPGDENAPSICNMGTAISDCGDAEEAERNFANGSLVIALRNNARALIEVAKASQVLRTYITPEMRDYPGAAFCALDAALAKLEGK